MSSVEKRILFLVDEDAIAASGRSAGHKKKRKVKHGKGPEEKKASGEVTQPALPPEELRRICLSNNRLEKWCHMPFFATTVTGCFVRAVFDASLSDPLHCVAEIVSVIEMKNDYKFGSKRTNLVLNLRHAGEQQIVTLRSVSNQEFTKSEFKQWKRAMIAAGTKVPTLEMIASKEKSIKEALDHTFTQEELDFVVTQKNRFRAAPLNDAKMMLQTVAKWSAVRSRGDADMLERKVLVASAASAGSGRSAGHKWKRQVEHGKGPEEKKARGEVTQPALRPEDLKRICLSNTMLVKWCHMPYFATTVTGCFVRAVFEDSDSHPSPCVAEIVSVMKAKNHYWMGSKWTDLVLSLRHAGEEQIVNLWSISNLEFQKSEFEQWKQAAGRQVPTLEMIATKEESIKEALDPTFNQGELDSIVDNTNRFRAAKRKLTLLEYQSAARSRGEADMVERKVPVASAASAALGRSAGSKRKRQVEQDQGPEEKKACVEVNQPALPPE
ncbi:unnamed protein product [Pleuronectes platessa]|uniref:Plus3 domain-containing protein n=1 Tax=Pleuronectes platessa TaxID=8262 RepID=A0A9N7YU37_PLEPL|nr:unnamed protein product [Pleuronectes platessa]